MSTAKTKLEIVNIEELQLIDESEERKAITKVIFSKGILKTDFEMTIGIITYEIYSFWTVTNYIIGINEDYKLFIEFKLEKN